MKSRPRTMWVWNTKELLLNGNERQMFFYFCRGKNVKEIFLQLPLSYKSLGTKRPVCSIQHQDELRNFLKETSSDGIKVHGLDGHPSFALRENHPRVFSIIQAVLDFNAASQPKEKFCGVHFDNEPYLLPGFQIAERRKILVEFLELNKKCAELIHSKDKGMVYGVDVPFWFAESVENMDAESTYVVPFNGKRKPTSFHLVDICDNVGVMDYRNFAGGPDGMIAHGANELVYADSKGKDLYVGVETSRYPDFKIIFVYGLEKPAFTRHFSKVEKELEEGIYFEGFKLKLFNDGIHVHAGLVTADNMVSYIFEEKLLKLARHVGKNFYGAGKGHGEKMLFDLKSLLEHNIEYRGFKQSELENVSKREHYYFFDVEEIMLPKISFAGKDEQTLETVLKETEEEFSKYSSFHGFAIHHYKSYQKLCTGIYLQS